MRNGMIVVMVVLGLLTGAAQAQPRAGLPCVGPVSYTHIDVYKRQGLQLLLQDLRGGTAALAPRLEYKAGHRTGAGAATAAAHAAVDQKGFFDLGNLGGELGNFSGIALHIIQRGDGVGAGDREDEAFIFHRCRFLRRAHIPVSYTHLDVYKRQAWPSLPA